MKYECVGNVCRINCEDDEEIPELINPPTPTIPSPPPYDPPSFTPPPFASSPSPSLADQIKDAKLHHVAPPPPPPPPYDPPFFTPPPLPSSPPPSLADQIKAVKLHPPKKFKEEDLCNYIYEVAYTTEYCTEYYLCSNIVSAVKFALELINSELNSAVPWLGMSSVKFDNFIEKYTNDPKKFESGEDGQFQFSSNITIKRILVISNRLLNSTDEFKFTDIQYFKEYH